LFETLRKVVFKHLGLEDLVENVLERMGNVDKIILVGDYAKGNDSGIIEVFLIGQDLNMGYISKLENKIEDLIGRKVSFYLASKFLKDKEHIVLFNSKDK
jgi:predicted nucleotidyltransferase